jgi:hypothetical protein
MAKLSQEEIKSAMDQITPSYFLVKGGDVAEFVVTLEDGDIYSTSAARVIHANLEHAARDSYYDVVVKDITPMVQVVEGKEVPIAIISVEVSSPIFGKRQNVMTAVLSSEEHKNPISSNFAIEVTQAIGRALSLYGFAFTGTMVSAEEMREGKDRNDYLEEAKKEDPLELIKNEAKKKGLEWNEFLEKYNVTEEQITESRSLLFQLLKQVRES